MDICADNALSLSVFRKNLRSAAIDVDRLMNDDPHLARELSQECLNLLQLGAVPPLPITTFPYRDYGEARSPSRRLSAVCPPPLPAAPPTTSPTAPRPHLAQFGLRIVFPTPPEPGSSRNPQRSRLSLTYVRQRLDFTRCHTDGP